MKRFIVFIIAISSLFGVTKTYAQVSVGVSVGIAPPALPVYVQPACPVEGYMWTPGYWAWGASGYFWVPGVWLRPARVGFLWTPGYWGFLGGHYWWHGGYWGEHVGFYGGVCYGYGYGGHGFYGGRWEGGAFRYNSAVCNVGGGIHNTYVDRTVINNNTNINRTSFNGTGGVEAKPNAEEQTAMKESHVQPTSDQMSHEKTASTDRNQLASVNKGKPSSTAMSTVGGQKFNSAGHNATAKTSTANNARSANYSRSQTSHTATNNSSQPNTNKQQAQHTAGGVQRQNTSHAQQSNNVQRGGGQRTSQPARGGQARPQGGGRQRQAQPAKGQGRGQGGGGGRGKH